MYQYKFVVDGKWRFSKLHPTCNDGTGNINNIINTNTFPISPVQKQTPINSEITSVITAQKTESTFSTAATKSDVDSYKSEFPNRKDLHVDATSCPENYKYSYSIINSSHRKPVGKPDYLKPKDQSCLTENASYISIAIPPHINLNHLCLKPSETPQKSQTIVTSTTQRVRNKFLTIIYCKPVN